MNIPVKTPPDVVKSFEKSYEILRDELINDLQTYNTPPEAVERMKEMLEHNVCGGKMNRGISVIDTLSIIAQSKGHQLTKEETFKAHVLGWGVEWLQACFLVADDVMDQSHTRRGKPCWYKVEGVGFNAINDAFLLESHIYKMFKKHFRQETYYADLLDLTHEVAYQTELGQLVDMITAPENDVNLKRFSLDRHRWIVEYKTAYYSFYLSVAMAMMMSGITDPKAYGQAKSILIPLGEYFQVQDDYLDCFGDPAVIGKIGTDIEDNKCSWLINQALVLASPAQFSILESNYGRKDAKCISEVKKVYKELKLEQVFEKYEEESHQRIMGLINSIDKSLGVPPEVYISFMKKIYKRNK
ncbi:ERG20 farnesyl diphosphate synthase [Paraphysoderma sedebokerense]|nr:ERG20 farnesyl diphosphate synthase [Paraphysoderma sedebokerense]